MTFIKPERNNTLDLLRLLAAILVILHHSYPLTGNNCLLGALGAIAVSIFFSISGYLIAQSWFSDPSPLRFMWKRFLRIVPGLAGAVVFTVFVIGPICTEISLIEYYSNTNTWSYLATMFIFPIQSTLPGVFVSNPYPIAVNGSLWTIPLEFRMYILLCLIGYMGLLQKRCLFLGIMVISILIYLTSVTRSIWILDLFINNFGVLGINEYLLPLINSCFPQGYPAYNLLFFVGTLFYLYKKEIKFNILIASGAFIGLVITMGSSEVSLFLIALLLCLPYLVMYIGQLPIQQLHNIGTNYGDYSYGLYIYAFPVQQTIAHFYPHISPIQMFLSSLSISFFLAFFSWWYIEKKSLSLKYINLLNKFGAFPKSQ